MPLWSLGPVGTKEILTHQLKFSGGYQNHYEAGAHDVQAGTEGTGFVQCREDTTRRFNCITQGGLWR